MALFLLEGPCSHEVVLERIDLVAAMGQPAQRATFAHAHAACTRQTVLSSSVAALAERRCLERSFLFSRLFWLHRCLIYSFLFPRLFWRRW